MSSQRSIRVGAVAGIAGPVIFTLGWFIAQFWQPRAYSPMAHTISDMYAYGAPRPWFLIVCVVLCGIGTIMLAFLSVRPIVAGHWTGTVGWILVATSIFGLGSIAAFVGREDCQLAAPACTGSQQLSNFGGMLDAVLSTIGVITMVAAGFFLGAALRRSTAELARFAWPCRLAGIMMLVLFVLDGLLGGIDLGGLAERIIAVVGTLELILLSCLTLRGPSPEHDRPGYAPHFEDDRADPEQNVTPDQRFR